MYRLEIPSLPRSAAASFVVGTGEPIEVPDAAQDVRFAHVPRADPRHTVRFLAGVPLRTPDGYALGALGVSDRTPRRLTPGQWHALACLARQGMRLLEARRAAAMVAQVTDAVSVLDQLRSPDDLPLAASLTADVSRSLLGANAVTVLLPEFPGSTVYRPAASATDAGTASLTAADLRCDERDCTGLGAMLRARVPVFVPDVAASPTFPADVVDRFTIASVLLVSLPGEGGPIGMIIAHWAVHLPSLDDPTQRAITMFGRQAAYALAKLRIAAARVRDGKIEQA
jgi:GAF domain-containing protein